MPRDGRHAASPTAMGERFRARRKRSRGLRAIGDRVLASVPVADLDARFLEEFGTPASGEGRILPLILKDKVAALVYADSGTDAAGLLDAGSLDLLVLSTSAWLEVNSLRKQAQKEPSAAHAGQSSFRTVTAFCPASHDDAGGRGARNRAPAFNDPFASHAPAFTPRQQPWQQRRPPATASVDVNSANDGRRVAPETAEAQSAPPKSSRRLLKWSLRLPSRFRSVMRRPRPLPCRTMSPRSRPRIRKCTARPSVLPACWSTRSNSIIRPKSPRAGKTKIFTTV
jgi:hypothetical protein